MVVHVKGLLLAGGNGTRLRPATLHTSKHMLPVGGKPMIYYGFRSLVDSGIRDIGIILGPHGDEVRKYLIQLSSEMNEWVNLRFIQQPQPLGLAHAIKISNQYLSDDDFVMYLGDNWFRYRIKNFIDNFDRNNADVTVGAVYRHDPRNYGVIELDATGHHITSIVEKPQFTRSHYAVAGCYVFSPIVHDVVRDQVPSARGELEITDAIAGVIKRHGKSSVLFVQEDDWMDMGRPEDITKLEQMLSRSMYA